ncbi:alpha/beta family hydrolase [Streptomyces sp. NPDC006733]|uniref:alpha/beta hydrolase n=1 Tax=Streptomyces sp. NPDC006733 TaxID=3155460 RepID=UPI0033EF05B2
MAQASPSAAVLILHGGRETGLGPPPRGLRNLPAVRMRPFARSLARATRDTDGGPVLLRSPAYTHRGWNGTREDPLHDVVRALDALKAEAGDIPVVLLGHSMGGRAALRAAGHPLVTGVVGLAPWCPAGDPVAQLADRDVVLIHGTRDRTTSPRASRELTAQARRAGARTCHVTLRDSDHAMLRRAPSWHRLATAAVTGLLGRTPLPPGIAMALALPPDASAAAGSVDLDELRARAAEGAGAPDATPAAR